MKKTITVFVVASAILLAGGCSNRSTTVNSVSREDINSVKFEVDVLQYLLQQTKPTGINIADVEWNPQSRELLVKLIAPDMKHQIIEYDTLATVMSNFFFKKRFTEKDHIRIQFIGIDNKVFKEYVDFDKFRRK